MLLKLQNFLSAVYVQLISLESLLMTGNNFLRDTKIFIWSEILASESFSRIISFYREFRSFCDVL